MRSTWSNKVISVGLSCAVLLAVCPGRADAEDPFSNSQNTEKLVDAYITAMTMAYPPAGGALAAAKGMMSTLGFFSKPDLVGEAIRQINERLDALQGRVDKLEQTIVGTRNEGRENANLNNVRELRRYRDKLEDVLRGLGQKPTDQFAKDTLARDAMRVANALLEDRQLWQWSDKAIKDHTWDGEAVKAGTFLNRDFKPLPTLEVYQAALATWLASIEYASGGNKDVIANTYGAALQRHIDYLSVRPKWNEFNDQPQTLPEQIQYRITTIYTPLARSPDTRQMCSIAVYVKDDMARQIDRAKGAMGQSDFVAQSKTELCAIPQRLFNVASPEEDALENAYGADSMALLVTKMEQLKRTGTLREAFVGSFDTSTKPKIPTADFAGVWAMKYGGLGGEYELTLRVNGDTVTGEFVNTADPNLKGTLSGTAENGRLRYTYIHPQTGETSRGGLYVKPDGISGGMYPPGAVQATIWKGTRVSGGVTSAAGTPGNFAGSWETITSGGGRFQLVLQANGTNVTGTFSNLDGAPQYKGTLSGTINGQTLNYTYAQPGINGTGGGSFVLMQNGDKINGPFKVDGDPTKYNWSGTRKDACVPPQFRRGNGTCGCEEGLRGPKCNEIIVN